MIIMKTKIWNYLSYYIKGLYNKLDSQHAFLLAGGLSFSIFICILPLMLIVFTLLGTLLDHHEIESQVIAYINIFIPYEKSAVFFRDVIFKRINDFKIFKTASGILGIIGLFFAASGLFSSLRTILNDIYKIKNYKNIVIEKLRDFLMVIMVVIFIIFSITLLPALDILINISSKFGLEKLMEYKLFFSSLSSLISILIIFLIIFTIYYYVPFKHLPIKVVAVSAGWSAFLWEIAKKIFSFYIANNASLNNIYGTYIFVIVIFFWIYYSSLVFITGAQIGQLYRERKETPDASRKLSV